MKDALALLLDAGRAPYLHGVVAVRQGEVILEY